MLCARRSKVQRARTSHGKSSSAKRRLTQRRETLEALETLEEETLRGAVTRKVLAQHRHVVPQTVHIDGGDFPHRVVQLVDDVRRARTLLCLIELDDVVGPTTFARRRRELRAELRRLVDERRRKRTSRTRRLDDIGERRCEK